MDLSESVFDKAKRKTASLDEYHKKVIEGMKYGDINITVQDGEIVNIKPTPSISFPKSKKN